MASVAEAFNYTTPIHHIFNVLTTVSFSHYVAAIRDGLKPVLASIKDAPNAPAPLEVRFAFLFPLRWFDYITRLVERFQGHLVDEFDDVELFKRLVQRASAERDGFREELKVGPDVLRETPAALLEAIGEDKGATFGISVHGRISDVAASPICLLHPQLFNDLKLFFGTKFALPRTIPFQNKQAVRVSIRGDYLVVSAKETVFAIPIFFAHTKVSLSEHTIVVVTPVGVFKVAIGGGLAGRTMLHLGLMYHEIQNDGLDEGEMGLATAKGKCCKCLGVYREQGSKPVMVRVMIIRAGRECECFDLCQAAVKEALPQGPAFFRARARDCADAGQSLIIV
jgi:hypothetical protein